jgi:Fe2+ or Zn2+ uptake regulation protein
MDKLPNFRKILQDAGSKVTTGRLLLLEKLAKESKPLSALRLQKKLDGALDKVTLYRALQSLTKVGVLRQVDFRHDHTHYELNLYRRHHHHIVCTHCGKIEDAQCTLKPSLKKDSSFKTILDHAVEFFGVCVRCAS